MILKIKWAFDSSKTSYKFPLENVFIRRYLKFYIYKLIAIGES